jgi:hypothetical protein
MGDTKEEGGLGAHLMQEGPDGKQYSIGFCSRQLKKHEKNYSAFLLELQAAVAGIEYFYQYLKGRSFVLYTDHAPLSKLSLTHQKTLHRLQQLLNENSFEIRHVPGKMNPVADFLSRSHGPATSSDPANCEAVDTGSEQISHLQRQDPLLRQIGTALKNNLPLEGLPVGMARYKDRIQFSGNVIVIRLPPRPGFGDDDRPRVLTPTAIRADLLREAHNSALGGHQGIFRTAERIRESFWWPSMQADIASHIKQCVTCQATSNKDRPPPHPHDKYPATRGPNQRVHADLFGPVLDKDSKPKYILGLTDSFTKMLRLVAIPDKTAKTVSWAIWKDWMAIYGVPKVIVTDQGREFCNGLQQAIWDLLKVKHSTTTPYWPVCNQQQEHQNKTLAQYLRAILKAAEKSTLDWEYYLPALMLSLNTAVNKATKLAPFKVMFGYDARLPLWSDMDILSDKEYPLPPSDKDTLYQWLDTRTATRALAFQNEAKFKEAEYDEQPPTPPQSYKAGEAVWVERLVPRDPNKKFGCKWDPAIIMERKGEHTYKIRRIGGRRKKITVINSAHLKPRTEEEEGEGSEEKEGAEEEEVEGQDPLEKDDSQFFGFEPQSTDSMDVSAIRFKVDGQWLNLEEFMHTKRTWTMEEITQIAQLMAKDKTPNYTMRLNIPIPRAQPPPLPPPAGGGGRSAAGRSLPSPGFRTGSGSIVFILFLLFVIRLSPTLSPATSLWSTRAAGRRETLPSPLVSLFHLLLRFRGRLAATVTSGGSAGSSPLSTTSPSSSCSPHSAQFREETAG